MARSAPEERRRRRLIITLVAAGLVLAALVAVGVYGLIAGPRHRPAPVTSATPGGGASPAPTMGAGVLPPLPVTNDAEAYADAVAHALFDWDTFTLLTRADHRAVLLDGADPSGLETPGLIRDLDNYLPSAETWRQLQEYRTAQQLTIEQIGIPDAWADALAAGGDAIADGTVAYTIEGTRHRTGVWFGKEVASEHPVAFTVFIACRPAFDQCRLLRLSALDTPLR